MRLWLAVIAIIGLLIMLAPREVEAGEVPPLCGCRRFPMKTPLN